ncbi:MAG TPA: hypothetical protein VLJ59_02915 [Mycobacteriales bacterium]|nr:hypothetical protein [Mycobacteriales bacterium]
MPTTTIELPMADPRLERRVAKELSLWWRRRGVDVNHVITRFATLPADRVYSGPFPLAGSFALVSCLVSRDRDHSFKRDYAHAVRAVLGPRIPPDRVFVSFHPTDPADHFTPNTWEQEDVHDPR